MLLQLQLTVSFLLVVMWAFDLGVCLVLCPALWHCRFWAVLARVHAVSQSGDAPTACAWLVVQGYGET